jgi:hypothetical protein
MTDEQRHLARITKAWEHLFSLDGADAMARASEMLGLEGFDLFRLRDAIRGQRSTGYVDIDYFAEVPQ